MKIVNPHFATSIHEQGMIMPPNKFGYIQLAVEIEKPFILKRDSRTKKVLIEKLRDLCSALIAQNANVQRADIFTAIIIPPGAGEGRKFIKQNKINFHIAEFDLVVLIECNIVEAIDSVKKLNEYKIIEDLLKSNSNYFHKTFAMNPSRIAEVDKEKQGIFLFNYFYSKNTQTVLDVWEYTAGWWTAKANLTNSTPLLPLNDDSQYSLINHCRWDHLFDVIPTLILGRLGIKPGLNNFVLKNFTENNIVAMPILYKLAF